jgi:ribonuclease R
MSPKRESIGTIKLKATVEKNRKGFGFLVFENKQYEDVFIPPPEAAHLFHGDRVESVMSTEGRVQKIQVLEHRFREVVGRFTPHPTSRDKGSGWVIYERKSTREEIFIPRSTLKIVANDWVRTRLIFHENGPHPVTGEVIDVYGSELPPSADIVMVAAEYGLNEAHSKGAENQARRQKLEITPQTMKYRQDLRSIPFITIDGETARDFDDAVYVERNKSGYILWVAIADVSYYVTDGSDLDRDARSKATSVYFPERAFHMLPRSLSENLCSLRPHEPRFCLVARMEFDRNAKRVNTQMMEAVIESKRRATYTEIQAESIQHRENKTWEFRPHFELYRALRKMRSDRGSIDFELPEAEVVVKPDGEVVSILNRPRLDAHRLIEEFMIAANEAATEWMVDRKWPFVYRVHDEPSFKSLEKFQALAATVGVTISIEGPVSPKTMSDVVKKLEGHPAQTLLNMALLRSMKQAIYSSTQGIHFGLASQAYTHFTSPIRRYPDLVVHRLIRMVLQRGAKLRPLRGDQRELLEEELAQICEHCSYRERLAADAERESIKIKQVRALAKHLGDEFDGQVVGMVPSGMFVRIDNPFVEGMVAIDSMGTDEEFEFNEERMIFYGRRTRRTFKIGDRLKVRAIRADLDKRQIDFALI